MARTIALSEPALARRTIVEHLGEYDWDGTIADACRDICTLLGPKDYHQIATRSAGSRYIASDSVTPKVS